MFRQCATTAITAVCAASIRFTMAAMLDRLVAQLKMPRLDAYGDVAILGNAVSKQEFQRVRGFDIACQVSTAAQAQPIFADFSDGGQIETSLHELTWSSAFGTVTDRLGTP